jgi:hypothetical protein
LRHAPDRAAHRGALRPQVVAGDPHLAGVARQQRGKHPEGRGLAGAVRAEQADDLAGRDCERDVVEDASAPAAHREPFDRDGRSGRHAPKHTPGVTVISICARWLDQEGPGRIGRVLHHYLAVALRNVRSEPLAFAMNVLTLAIGLACFVTVYALVAFWGRRAARREVSTPSGHRAGSDDAVRDHRDDRPLVVKRLGRDYR